MAACCLRPATGLHNYQPNTALTASTTPVSRFLTCSSSHHSTNHFIFISFIHRSNRPSTCRATSPGPPTPPESDPPTTGKRPDPPSGLPMTLSRFKDTVQIFCAVLFWLGLFFWASAWDGRNNGKSDKGSRF